MESLYQTERCKGDIWIVTKGKGERKLDKLARWTISDGVADVELASSGSQSELAGCEHRFDGCIRNSLLARVLSLCFGSF